jgi:hypothetical protein
VRFVDPTGRWSEDELKEALGDEWYDRYFGERAVFSGRSALLDMLRSPHTSGSVILGMIRDLFGTAGAIHSIGVSFEAIDAIGGRGSYSFGSLLMGEIAVDTVLNLKSGEFSVFLSPGLGVMLGAGVSLVGGPTLITGLPSNSAFKGVFDSVGAIGGEDVAGCVEVYAAGPLREDVPAGRAWGGFIGGGAGEALGVYLSVSYSVEVYRTAFNGGAWFPEPPSLGRAVGDFMRAWWLDIIRAAITLGAR